MKRMPPIMKLAVSGLVLCGVSLCFSQAFSQQEASKSDKGTGAIIIKPVPDVKIKGVPEMKLLSGALEYVQEQQKSLQNKPRLAFPCQDVRVANLLFWRGMNHVFVTSYPSNNGARRDGLRFREIALSGPEAGQVKERGQFGYGKKIEDSPIDELFYTEYLKDSVRLWFLHTHSRLDKLAVSTMVVTGKDITVEHTQSDFRQKEFANRLLSKKFLRAYSQANKEARRCEYTDVGVNPITVTDAVGKQYARFEMPNGYGSIRIPQWPLILSGKEFIGLLSIIKTDRTCFVERPPLDLLFFRAPHPQPGQETQVQPAQIRIISGAGEFLQKLKQEWKVEGSGTIEWAELLSDKGDLVLRRDTRVEQQLWCTELWHYDAEGKGTLIDFMLVVQDGSYSRRFTINEKGEVTQVPHRSDYWGVWMNLVPAVSPNKKKVAYAKWDSIWIADLP